MGSWFGTWDEERVRRWKETLFRVVSVALVAALATYGATVVARTREAEREMRFAVDIYLVYGDGLVSAVRGDGEGDYRFLYRNFLMESSLLYDQVSLAKRVSAWKVDEKQYEEALVFLTPYNLPHILPNEWRGEAEELAAIGLLEDYLTILGRADRNSRDPRDFKSLLKQLEADEAVPAWSRALSDYVRGRQIRGTWP